VIKMYLGTTWVKMYGIDSNLKDILKNELRFHPVGYCFSTKYNKFKADGTRVWDGYVNLLIDRGEMLLTYSGLVPRIIKILQSNNLEFDIVKQYANNLVEIKDIELKDIELRPYQKEAVAIGKIKKRGIFFVATGGGKGELMFKLTADIQLKTLIIVNRITLFRQLLDKFKKRLQLKDDEINTISGDIKNYNPNNRITIATFQSLLIKEKTEKKSSGKWAKIKVRYEDVLKNAEVIHGDEIHHTSQNELGSILKKCTSASIRFGYSATPRREDGYDMMLEAHIGPIIYKKGISDLIKEGYLSKPKIYMLKIPYFLNKRLTYKAAYKQFIKSDLKNKIVAEIAYRFGRIGKSVLISFSRIEHLKLVKTELDKINDLDLVIETVIGNDTADFKEEAIYALNTKKYNIVLSTLFGEGIDLPRLDVLMNLRNAKSNVDCYQQTGRALRIGDGTKYIIDFFDYNSFDGQLDPKLFEDVDNDNFMLDIDEEYDRVKVKDFFKSYSKGRLAIYKSEPEFEVHMIDDINQIEEINMGGNVNAKGTDIVGRK
jgi:superfamily II DNA or RNA helicase